MGGQSEREARGPTVPQVPCVNAAKLRPVPEIAVGQCLIHRPIGDGAHWETGVEGRYEFRVKACGHDLDLRVQI
jgi:hypothetical protein